MAIVLSAGELDRRIVIQSNTPSTNSIGESVESWGTFATLWAKFKPRAGNETLVAGTEVAAQADAVFWIRYRSDITPQMRVTLDGGTWDIVSVQEIGRRVGTEIVGRRRQA